MSDFQSITLDLHLVKPNLCARGMRSPVKHQAIAIPVQLEFLAAQPLLIGTEIGHRTRLSGR
ncbi:MAG: hypothetical protein ACXVJ2_03965 [Candidatus Angelobacter sp.]